MGDQGAYVVKDGMRPKGWPLVLCVIVVVVVVVVVVSNALSMSQKTSECKQVGDNAATELSAYAMRVTTGGRWGYKRGICNHTVVWGSAVGTVDSE